MASLSLTKSIRTCKVDTSLSDKIQSDRFLNSNNAVCIPWSGQDITGRKICADSFYTKSAGCNSSLDRVLVENDVARPSYMEYINLSAAGIQGDMYGNIPVEETLQASQFEESRNAITGNYGIQFKANDVPACNIYAYERIMAEQAEYDRMAQYTGAAYTSHTNKMKCGMK